MQSEVPPVQAVAPEGAEVQHLSEVQDSSRVLGSSEVIVWSLQQLGHAAVDEEKTQPGKTAISPHCFHAVNNCSSSVTIQEAGPFFFQSLPLC